MLFIMFKVVPPFSCAKISIAIIAKNGAKRKQKLPRQQKLTVPIFAATLKRGNGSNSGGQIILLP